MSAKHLIVEIANIVFSISSDHPIAHIELEQAYQDFLSNSSPDINIRASYGFLPSNVLENKDRVFDSGVHWSLYALRGKHVFVLRRAGLPYRIAMFDKDYQNGEVYTSSAECSLYSSSDVLPNPLEYPLSEVLMICLLGRERGLMAHACGINDNGKGYLFAGNSTHGKSTMAEVWKNKATILNDDRIVLRCRDGRFWMYGTPWHGEYTDVSSHGVPLEKIFFLGHGQNNRVKRRQGVVASSMLLARSFPPLWDRNGMQFILNFCAELVHIVPCYELDFVPDISIVEYVRSVS